MRIDIIPWLTQQFPDIKPYDDANVQVECPFCPTVKGSPDTEHHCHIHTSKSMFHCFRCGESGTWVDLISQVEHCSVGASLSRLNSMSFEGLPPLYTLLTHHLIQDPVDMPEDFVNLTFALTEPSVSVGVKVAARRAQAYVSNRLRDLPMDDQHYRAGQYLSEWGVWQEDGYGKLVMPVERGWWQERAIEDGFTGHKYDNPHIPKRDRLYNARALNEEYVYVAEGIFSAVFLGKNAVALCSKEANQDQLKRLVGASVERYIVCLDSDAQKDALKLAKQLFSGGKKVTVRLYADGDPAEYTYYQDVEYQNGLTEVEVRLR